MADQKAIADHTAQDKIKEARAAMRNMNAHTATIIQHTSDQANTMKRIAYLLRRVADEMGGVTIMHQHNHNETARATSVKELLQASANSLIDGVAE